MFKILSLDGGGIRGTFIAAFLAKIQASIDQPLVSYFDLIAGTSTGGLIAVALAMGITPEEIEKLYKNEGPQIFTRPPPELSALKRRSIDAVLRRLAPSLDAEWLYRAKYNSEPLKTALEKRLNDKILEEALCRLVVPSVDLTAGKVIVFKTPHRPNFVRDRKFRAVDVVLATTAAPSYFPSASIEIGSSYCDGGIWANNPALVGYVESLAISRECLRQEIDPCFSEGEIFMVSIGTGRASYFVQPNNNESGLRWWANRLLDISGEAQSEGIHWQMEYILGDRYKRINFDIPDGNWSLDSTENIDALLYIGSQRATENFPYLKSTFLAQPCTRYSPF